MAYIKATIDYTIEDGSEVIFRSPVDYASITGLTVCYPDETGTQASKSFTFVDAHMNDVTQLSDLFVTNAIVKVLLDYSNSYAFIQNADTNAYLEDKFNQCIYIRSSEESDGEDVELLDGPIYQSEKGAPNGIATLDETGKVPANQLPEIEIPDVSGQIGTHNTDPNAHADIRESKQDKLTGTQGQLVGFDSDGNAVAQDINIKSMTGATSSANGTSGLVPGPSAGDQDKFLKGDGTWADIITEDWVFTLEDGSTVTKKVHIG